MLPVAEGIGTGDVIILETERLVLREFVLDDAPFILDLLNQPSFHRFIGDKGVRTLEDARAYLRQGPIDSYATHGFGLYHVALKESMLPIGMCGLLKREALPHPDIGFAFLPAYWSRGYATESARAVLDYAVEVLALNRILAVTSTDNHDSMNLLGRLGFRSDGTVRLTVNGPDLTLLARVSQAGATAVRPGDRPRTHP